jgi:hypothetical protein
VFLLTTSYLGAGWKEAAQGETLGSNSYSSCSYGSNDTRHCSDGQCSNGGTAYLRSLATSAVRVSVGMAVFLELEMVH